MAMVELYQAGDGECRPHTVDGSRTGFPVYEEEQTVNKWGIETADRGRQTAEWTAAGEAFQPVEEANRQRMGNE
jgi:hypothetical protein